MLYCNAAVLLLLTVHIFVAEFGKRSFSCLAITISNKLPVNTETFLTADTIELHLKSHFFVRFKHASPVLPSGDWLLTPDSMMICALVVLSPPTRLYVCLCVFVGFSVNCSESYRWIFATVLDEVDLETRNSWLDVGGDLEAAVVEKYVLCSVLGSTVSWQWQYVVCETPKICRSENLHCSFYLRKADTAMHNSCTPWVKKKGATLTMAVTLSILDRFAKFFHYCKDQ